MVVCHCNAIRERDVRAVARTGAECPIRAYAQLGCRPRCGQCIPYARELIAEERLSAD